MLSYQERVNTLTSAQRHRHTTLVVVCGVCVCRTCASCASSEQFELIERLTWHDPLADQFLSCASLLEFELEDCMETEERRESATAGVSNKLQKASL